MCLRGFVDVCRCVCEYVRLEASGENVIEEAVEFDVEETFFGLGGGVGACVDEG